MCKQLQGITKSPYNTNIKQNRSIRMEKKHTEKKTAKIVILTTPSTKASFKRECETAGYTMSERIHLLIERDLQGGDDA